METSSVALQQVMSSALRRAVLCCARPSAGDVIGRFAANDVVRSTARSLVLCRTEYWSAGDVIGRFAASDVVRSTARIPVLCRIEYWRAGDVIGRFAASDVVHCTVRSDVLTQDLVPESW